jgi:hypothetical protein
MLDRRDCLRLIAAGLPAWRLLGGPSFPTTVADRVDRRWEAPYPRPTGIKATRDGIWLIDGETAKAYLMGFNGQIKVEIETGTQRPTAIETDEVGLWIAGDQGRKMIRIDFGKDEAGKTNYETSSQQAEFGSPGVGPAKWGAPGEYLEETGVQGVAWIRGELFLAVPPAAKIFVVKAQTGSVVREIPAPGVRPQGLVFDPDGDLWCADANSRSFFKLDTATGNVIKQHMLPFDQPQVNGKVINPHGLTIWQRMLYFCSPETGEIYRTPLVNRLS